MNRLQRKLLLVSAAAHTLLLVVLVVGPAFVPQRKTPPPKDLPILHVIPSRLIDGGFSREGGGPTPPQQQPVPPKPTPRVEPKVEPKVEPPKPPEVAPQPVPQPRQQPVPPKPTPRVEPKVEPKVEPPKPAPKTPIKVNRKLLQPRADDARAAREARERKEAEERKRQALEETLRSAVQGIEASAMGKTDVQTSGPGGAAYADYRQVVQTYYDKAWNAPQDVGDSRASVEVEVTIHRTGKVVRDRIVKRSGISSLDRSVEEALYRVRSGGLPAFPQEAQDRGDMERVFRINFNLSSKLSLG